ncbi:MAG: radical SAM protein [Spirochaetales bacterium]|nr:radical SAM protein [Spirochaetales bacterium]
MILLLDFYVDEPACFGVPPYLSPYVRYSAGALRCAGIPADQIAYQTVDAWRTRGGELPEGTQAVVLIGGHTVPGKYLGGKIGTMAEMKTLLSDCRKKRLPVVMGGPLRYASREHLSDLAELGGVIVRGDIESFLYQAFSRKEWRKELEQPTARDLSRKRHYEEVDRFAAAGAFVSQLHPNFPYLICEIETYRGCTRDVFCSFCTEAFYGRPEFRSINGIEEEVAALSRAGNRFFRLGRQADLLTYQAQMADWKNSFPRPQPEKIAELYQAIHRSAPDLRLLHLDNINPGLIATFPEEARAGLEIIAHYNTAGDTAAMGLESVDPLIVSKNHLKCSREEALLAVRMVNEAGGRRKNGIPALLPGLNFIHGLPGETDQTFKNNYLFLKEIYDRGLSLRRINIRQVVRYRNTRLSRLEHKETGRLHERFLYYRDRIRREIDRPMLQRVFPPGTVLKDVLLEAENQGYYLGRQLGSYPVTVKIPTGDRSVAFPSLKTPLNVVVVGAEERSLLGLGHPIHIATLDSRALSKLPGIGRRLAVDLKLRPPQSRLELEASSLDPALAGAFSFPPEQQPETPS